MIQQCILKKKSVIKYEWLFVVYTILDGCSYTVYDVDTLGICQK